MLIQPVESGKTALLEIQKLTKYFVCEEAAGYKGVLNKLVGKKEVGIENFSLSIHAGQIIGITGEHKCGKSTLLKILCGLIPFNSGTIIYKGKKIGTPELYELAHYVAKEKFTTPEYSLTLFECILRFVAEAQDSRTAAVDKAEELIEAYGLEPYKFKEMAKISMEARNRVAIVRGLISNKPILCFDQPYSYIESQYIPVFNNHLKALAQSGRTIILTTTDSKALEDACTQVITM